MTSSSLVTHYYIRTNTCKQIRFETDVSYVCVWVTESGIWHKFVKINLTRTYWYLGIIFRSGENSRLGHFLIFKSWLVFFGSVPVKLVKLWPFKLHFVIVCTHFLFYLYLSEHWPNNSGYDGLSSLADDRMPNLSKVHYQSKATSLVQRVWHFKNMIWNWANTSVMILIMLSHSRLGTCSIWNLVNPPTDRKWTWGLEK